MGLCDVLGNVITTLSQDNTLLSWSVYHEKNGQISVKIRFEPVDESPKRDKEDIHYKRKSTRQVQRDHARTLAWQKKCRVESIDVVDSPGIMSSPEIGVTTRNKARLRNMDQPEVPRCESTAISEDIVLLDPEATPFSLDQSRQDISVLLPADTLCHTDVNNQSDVRVCQPELASISCAPESDDSQQSDQASAIQMSDSEMNALLVILKSISNDLRGTTSELDAT